MKFYMVYSYIYDGTTGHNDVLFPASSEHKAMEYLFNLRMNDEEYEWNTLTSLRKKLPGEYDYEEIYFEELTMDEEV